MDHRISINTWLYNQRWEKLEILYRVAYDSNFWSHILEREHAEFALKNTLT